MSNKTTRPQRVERCLNLARNAAATDGERQAAINAANRLISGDEVPFAASDNQPYPWQWSGKEIYGGSK